MKVILFNGSSRSNGCKFAALSEVAHKYLQFAGMPIVTSTYWNMVHGNTPEEVVQDLEGMQIMRNLRRNMAWILKCIEAGKETGNEMPERETVAKTNFIR